MIILEKWKWKDINNLINILISSKILHAVYPIIIFPKSFHWAQIPYLFFYKMHSKEITALNENSRQRYDL